MEQKQKYVKAINTHTRTSGIMGPLSIVLPGKKLILSYSDTTWEEVSIDESNVNVSENPLTGKIDVSLKLSLERKVKE